MNPQTNITPLINQHVLMSGADYFGDDDAINDLMDAAVPVDVEKAKATAGPILNREAERPARGCGRAAMALDEDGHLFVGGRAVGR